MKLGDIVPPEPTWVRSIVGIILVVPFTVCFTAAALMFRFYAGKELTSKIFSAVVVEAKELLTDLKLEEKT